MLTYVYNDDGTQPMSHVRLGHVREDLEQWIDWVLDTPVQAYVGCTAHPEICCHDTKVGERFGARREARFTRPSAWLRVQAQNELIAEGTDQLRVLAERAHARGKLFLAGMRMSDAHHRSSRGVAPHESPGFPQYTLDHPEYRMTRPDGSPDVTLDYSFEDVRNHRLAILTEIVRDYPVHGLELDFMRFCRHFPRPATNEQIAIMTGFVRAIRRMMDEQSRSGGVRNPLILGVRVPPTVAECAPNGLDPGAWAQEGLIDYLSPANFLWADFNIPVQDYLAHVKGTECQVLFAIQPWTANRGSTQELLKYRFAYAMELPEFRALAATGLAAGTQGLHCFNLCCELPGRRGDICTALRAMASREAIFAGPRHYQYFPSDPGETPTGANHRQTLRFDELGVSGVFRFQTGEAERQADTAGRLGWRIYNGCPTDTWRFALNGRILDPARIRVEMRYAGHPVRVGAQLPAHAYFEIDLQDMPALALRNELAITPLSLETGVECDRSMEVLEVWAEG